MKVHTFNEKFDTGHIYDLTQTSDGIQMGDILVCPAEKVVGFLLAAWPTAVTKEHQSFHSKDPKATWERLAAPNDFDSRDWMPSVKKAMEVAEELGYEIDR